MPPTILIADDHPLFREALKLAITQALVGARTFEADTVDSLLATLQCASGNRSAAARPRHARGAWLFRAGAGARALPFGAGGRDLRPRRPGHRATHAAARRVGIHRQVRGGLDHHRCVADHPAAAACGPHPTRASIRPPAARVHPDEADAARRVASLTPQQFRVLSMLCSGQSNKRIALQIEVSEATVKAHMTAILEKMGAENRTQAVLIAQRLALHQFAPPAPEEDA